MPSKANLRVLPGGGQKAEKGSFKDLLPPLGLMAVVATFGVGAKQGVFSGGTDRVQAENNTPAQTASEAALAKVEDNATVKIVAGEGPREIAKLVNPEVFEGPNSSEKMSQALTEHVDQLTDGNPVIGNHVVVPDFDPNTPAEPAPNVLTGRDQ